jgi:peptidoglycan LD-endopeptidase CwlK
MTESFLWSNPGAKETDKIKYVNHIPKEIVKVFEKHGFIWGGRWYHYDTMHFEYRPELID